MAPAGRDIQEIPRFDHVALAADTPAPAPGSLHKKYVVRIDVRTDPAAPRGEAHHHVVEPRLRHELEAAQQPIRSLDMKIHAAHEQGRICLFEGNAFERPVRGIPPLARALHQTGFNVIARGERGKRMLVEHATECRQCTAHEKRELLPMPAQESARRQAAQQT